MTRNSSSLYSPKILIIVIASVIFTHVLNLPFFQYKFQFTEIIFIPFFLYYLSRLGIGTFISGLLKKSYPLKLPFLFLVGVLLVNVIIHSSTNVFMDVAGCIYLITLYFLLVDLYRHLSKDEFFHILSTSSDIALKLLIFIGFLGPLLHYTGLTSKFVLIYDNYPYFGDVFRVRGFSFSPNLYISILTFFLVLKATFNKVTFLELLLVFSIALLSLTKEGLLLIAMISIIIASRYGIKRFHSIYMILIGLTYIFLSYFVISFRGNSIESHKDSSQVYSNVPIYSNESIEIYPTTYFELLRGGIHMFRNNFFLGVGLNNYQTELDKYQEEGIYPKKLLTYEPHDSYGGIAAQLGFLYLIFLIWVFKHIKLITSRIKAKYPLLLVYYLIYIGFESLAIGSMQYRHYYILFSIITILYIYENNSMINSKKTPQIMINKG